MTNIALDLNSASFSFPRLPHPQIPRDNILDLIESMFAANLQIVILEGAEGMGKTSCVAQFAQRHSNRAISLFIRPTGRWAYDLDMLRWDLCNQLEWALNRTLIQSQADATDTLYWNRIYHLDRRSKQAGQEFFFVIDGIDEIPDNSEEIKRAIFEMLPFHLGYRFLFSSSPDQLNKYLPKRSLWKPLILPGFNLDETIHFFTDVSTDRGFIEELYHTCRKNPLHLAGIRRLLSGGIKLSAEDLPTQLRHVLEMEWSTLPQTPDLSLLLAVIAYGRSEHTIGLLSNIMRRRPEEIQAMLDSVAFVEVDNQTRVRFVSESYRRYLAEQLRPIRQAAYDLLIDHLIREPLSEKALMFLPGYFEAADRDSELLQYLSPDSFAEMVAKSQSLTAVGQKAELGLITAQSKGKDGELLRFALIRSIFGEMARTEVYSSEVEARLALGDFESAVTLAQSVVLQEHRLRLLALIAKKQLELGQSLDPNFSEQIRQLYHQIDPMTLGQSAAAEIAADLVHSHPDLALDMIERASQGKGPASESLDWALAKLSVAATSLKGKEDTNAAEKIRLQIKDPEALRVSAEGSLLFGDYSATQLLDTIKSIPRVDDRLYLMRQWVVINQDREDAADVVQQAMELIIRTTEYSPSATVYRELAMALPSIKDTSRLRLMVSLLSSQMNTVESVGPTEDLLWLKLILAKCEWSYDTSLSRNRLSEAYLSLDAVSDAVTKASCISRFISVIDQVDPDLELESALDLHSALEQDLNDCLATLLEVTAEHVHSTRSIISALAVVRPAKALQVALSLNTEPRRDAALHLLVKESLEANIPNLHDIGKVIEKISDTDLQGRSILRMIERLAGSGNLTPSHLKSVLPFLSRISEIWDSDDRCKAYCYGYGLLSRPSPTVYSGLQERLLSELEATWSSIDNGWKRVEVGFKIVAFLSDHNPAKAKEYLSKTEELQKAVLIDDATTAATCSLSLQLAVRAFSGLFPRGLDTDDDWIGIEDLIERIPSISIRAQAWGELAIRAYTAGKQAKCESVVTEKVNPLLERLPRSDKSHYYHTLIRLAPALYYAHHPTALELLDQLPMVERDIAFSSIFTTILTKFTPYDPLDPAPGQVFEVSYENCVDLIKLLEHMSEDSEIYSGVRDIVDSVALRRTHFTAQQISSISEKLHRLICDKVPNPRYIRHDGYRLVCEAQLSRIQQVRSDSWDSLVQAARRIVNLPDRVYVLTIIAVALPPREAVRRSDLLKEVMTILSSIPSAYDRVIEYQVVARSLFSMDRSVCQDCLKAAMELTKQSKTENMYSQQRQIIDLAYRIDKEFAGKLVELVDDDPARNAHKRRLQRDLEILRLREKFSEPSEEAGEIHSNNRDYAQAAWRALAALNADRRSHQHFEFIRRHVVSAARMSVHDAYNICAWALQNAIQRNSRTDQARVILRPLFEATLMSAQLAARIAGRTFSQFERTRLTTVMSHTSEGLLVRPGERDRANAFLTRWFEHEVGDYIKICDPWFGPSELTLLKMLLAVAPKCKVHILTSKRHQDQEGVPHPWDQAYRSYWRERISDQQPPETDVTIMGTATGDFPIHDRWWLSNGAGLRIGSSYNSLGVHQMSEISSLPRAEALEREREVDRYLKGLVREHMGQKLSVFFFPLTD